MTVWHSVILEERKPPPVSINDLTFTTLTMRRQVGPNEFVEVSPGEMKAFLTGGSSWFRRL